MSEEVVTQEPDNKEIEPEAPVVEGKSSGDIKEILEGAPAQKEIKKESPSDPPKEEEWFDKEKGFKTKDDALKSYSEAQNKLRELSEEKKRYESELAQIKKKESERPLTEEEKSRQASIQQWKDENKDAIQFLKDELKKDLERENQVKDFEKEALAARKQWKEEFDKDESRRTLWPKMEEIYSKKDFFHEVSKNPLEVIEALAFKESFPSIAEKIRAEAIEQYKEQVKEAEVAEKKRKTAVPGGSKKSSEDVDPSKMSSSELAGLLGRSDNG